jgi:hypothetical protein
MGDAGARLGGNEAGNTCVAKEVEHAHLATLCAGGAVCGRTIHSQCGCCSGKTPRCFELSVRRAWSLRPPRSIVHARAAPRRSSQRPLSWKTASARSQSSGPRSGRHHALGSPRTSSTSPKRSSLRPPPESSSWCPGQAEVSISGEKASVTVPYLARRGAGREGERAEALTGGGLRGAGYKWGTQAPPPANGW